MSRQGSDPLVQLLRPVYLSGEQLRAPWGLPTALYHGRRLHLHKRPVLFTKSPTSFPVSEIPSRRIANLPTSTEPALCQTVNENKSQHYYIFFELWTRPAALLCVLGDDCMTTL